MKVNSTQLVLRLCLSVACIVAIQKVAVAQDRLAEDKVTEILAEAAEIQPEARKDDGRRPQLTNQNNCAKIGTQTPQYFYLDYKYYKFNDDVTCEVDYEDRRDDVPDGLGALCLHYGVICYGKEGRIDPPLDCWQDCSPMIEVL